MQLRCFIVLSSRTGHNSCASDRNMPRKEAPTDAKTDLFCSTLMLLSAMPLRIPVLHVVCYSYPTHLLKGEFSVNRNDEEEGNVFPKTNLAFILLATEYHQIPFTSAYRVCCFI